MARRIVSAREQFELLSPWRTAAGEPVPPGIHELMPGKFSDGNGRWDYRHQETSGDYYKRHEYGIHPVTAPATHNYVDDIGRSKTIHYDPALTEGKPPVDETGNGQQFRNEVTDLQPPPNMLWRGMSREEYEKSRDRGYFESNGTHNIGNIQKGHTFFSTNPVQAGNYATWFAPPEFKPTFTHPGYVIGIPDRTDLPRGSDPTRPNPNDTEVGVPGRVPFNEVTHHYVGRPSAIRPGRQGVSEGWHGWETSGSGQPSSDIVWSHLNPGQHTAARTPSRPGYAQWGIIGDDRHMFPLETLIPHMTRREIGFGDEKSSYQSGPPLSQRITEQGYENPVEFETDGQSGYLRDGNHRLDVARTLGHSHVPVQVRWNSNSDGSPIGAPIHPWIKDWLAGIAPGHKTVGRRITASEFPLFLNKHGEPMGININDSKQDFTGQILRGEKSIETRDSNSLRRYIGKRIGLIRTGLGKAHVVGYATIGEPKFYDDVHDFDADYDLHRVDTNSDYHFDYAKYGVKFGYPFHDVEHEPDPYPVNSDGRVDRPIPRQAERAEDFEWERSFDGPGGWELITRTPDGNPVTVETEPTRGQRSAALVSDDQMHTARVDAAEQVMTRSGLAGKTYHVPGAKPADARALGIDHWDLQRQHSAEAEKFVNDLVRENGFDHQGRGWVTVKPHPWAARDMSPNVQAWTDGGHIYLPGEHVNKLSLVHEAAHILAGTQEGEGHGPDFQRTLHGLYHQHLGPEAADIFAGIVFPDQHTAALDKTLEQHLRDTYEPHPPGDSGLPEGLVPHLMLPTDIAHHYREYDRPMDDENTAMLMRVIADQGIRQPLRISTDGTHAILHEGNHRLAVARQLGISHVPVQVTLEKPGEIMTNSADSRPVPLEPVLGEWVNQNRQNLKSFWS